MVDNANRYDEKQVILRAIEMCNTQLTDPALSLEDKRGIFMLLASLSSNLNTVNSQAAQQQQLVAQQQRAQQQLSQQQLFVWSVARMGRANWWEQDTLVLEADRYAYKREASWIKILGAAALSLAFPPAAVVLAVGSVFKAISGDRGLSEEELRGMLLPAMQQAGLPAGAARPMLQ